MRDTYRGPLGRLRKRWINQAEARMESDPEYQRKLSEIIEEHGEKSWEELSFRMNSCYMDNRPWYWKLYWKQQTLRSWYYGKKFYVRRHIFKIRRPKGYWHFTHADKLICPDCDYEDNWCESHLDDHACTAQILTTEDVHNNVNDGYLEAAKCDECGVLCPQ